MDEKKLKGIVMPNRQYILTFQNIFDDGTFDVKVTALGFREHGFDCKSGGWSLYNFRNDKTSAIFLVCKKYRCKKISSFNIKNIIIIKALT